MFRLKKLNAAMMAVAASTTAFAATEIEEVIGIVAKLNWRNMGCPARTLGIQVLEFTVIEFVSTLLSSR